MSYVTEVLADSPVAYWRMGESTGNIQDSVGTNHSTSIVGTPNYLTGGAIRGDSNTSIQFDGSTYFSIPDATPLDLGDVFTIECWARNTAAAGIEALVSKGAGGYYLRMNNDFLELCRSNTAIIVASTVIVPVNSNHHHLVATKNGATVALYIDGVDRTGTVTNSTVTNTNDPLFIGSDRAVEFHNNRLDEVALYPTALSGARVLAHYNAGQPPTVPSVLLSGL